MSKEIEPALTAEEWRILRDGTETYRLGSVNDVLSRVYVPSAARIIAVMNDRLDAEDPRKITHAWLDELLGPANEVALQEIVRVLRSYLPPETP